MQVFKENVITLRCKKVTETSIWVSHFPKNFLYAYKKSIRVHEYGRIEVTGI